MELCKLIGSSVGFWYDIFTLVHCDLVLSRLGRLQDSNAVLSHFNDFSDRSFTAVANDFSQNTRLLKSMKSDLDYVFRKIGYGHLTVSPP